MSQAPRPPEGFFELSGSQARAELSRLRALGRADAARALGENAFAELFWEDERGASWRLDRLSGRVAPVALEPGEAAFERALAREPRHIMLGALRAWEADAGEELGPSRRLARVSAFGGWSPGNLRAHGAEALREWQDQALRAWRGAAAAEPARAELATEALEAL